MKLLIHDILGLGDKDNVYFIEDSYASLKNNTLSLQYLEKMQKHKDAMVGGIRDENGEIPLNITCTDEQDG